MSPTITVGNHAMIMGASKPTMAVAVNGIVGARIIAGVATKEVQAGSTRESIHLWLAGCSISFRPLLERSRSGWYPDPCTGDSKPRISALISFWPDILHIIVKIVYYRRKS